MPEISAAQIKELRGKTGASIMMIKKALEEASGDESLAVENLKKLGHSAAEKKAARDTNAGRIEAYVHTGAKIGVIVEIRSETDFVSRNADFEKLAHEVAMHIAASSPVSVDELLGQPFIKDEGVTVGELVKQASATFGEHIEIKRFERYEL